MSSRQPITSLNGIWKFKQNAEYFSGMNGYNQVVNCKDNLGNTFNSYREAARFYNLAANTVKNDCLGKTKYSPTQKGTSYERKIRFRRLYES